MIGCIRRVTIVTLIMSLCYELCILGYTSHAFDSYETNDFFGNTVSVNVSIQNLDGTASFLVSGTSRQVSLIVESRGTNYVYKTGPDTLLTVPLNMGDGAYTFTVYLHVTQTKAEHVWSRSYDIELDNRLAPFLNPSQMVNWSSQAQVAEAAKRLTENKNHQEAAMALCNYIVDNYTYTGSQSAAWYIPDLELVQKQKQGVCYDFAVLYAAMCRSVGIPCKLEFGYSQYMKNNQYHAWCSVYIDDSWYVVDPTYSMTFGSGFLNPEYTRVKRVY